MAERIVTSRQAGVRPETSRRLLIAAAEPIVRYGLEQALQGQFASIETAGTVDSALIHLSASHVSSAVLVLDPPLPGATFEEACAMLVAGQPGVRSLVLLNRPTEASVRAALSAGARGIYERNVDIPDLRHVLYAVEAGTIQVQDSLIRFLVDPIATKRDTDAPTLELTNRERVALRLLSEGWTSKQIAVLWGISSKGVDMAVERAARRIGAVHRTQAVAMAVRAGLI